MLIDQHKWSEKDNELFLEFAHEERRRREERGRAYQDGYAEGVRVGMKVVGTEFEGFFK
jgi:hypothetical protein